PGLAPLAQATYPVPGTTNLFAISSRYAVVQNAPAQALVFDADADDVAGFVLQRDIPSAVDPLDSSSLETVANREIDALIQLSGSPLVRDRLERSSRIFVNADRPLRVLRTLSSSQLLTFGTPTTAFAVRNRLLGVLSGKDPSMLGLVPQGPATATQDTQQVVNFSFRFGSGKLFIGVVASPAMKLRENLAALNDFSNGSHLADESASLATRCEKRTTPALKTDFLFVIDNTISMVEEQQALQDAAQGLFDAFQRAGLDFRLGVVTTDSDVLRGNGFVTTLNDFRAAARVGLDGNTTELGIEFGLRALRRARMSMTPNLTLRDSMSTGLVVIFMSDEDNKSIRPGMFGSYIADYRMEGAVAFSIVGPKPTGCIRVGRGEAQPGDQYIDLANGTGGSSGSICNPNLTEVIEEVVIGALGASSRSALERRPISGSLSARTTMALMRNRSNGFDYEPAANSILFFGMAAPTVGGPYDAAYQFFNYID
ncbi:MAG: VWA domain-containing protein, partial [Myxococcus sp.]|nr:VWA domain-containing protein [Myxococcus sp.]